MLEELLKEFDELREYKKRYEYAVKEKERMSELLYEYMMKEYEGMTKEERANQYKREWCACCRYNDICDFKYPEDICKPILSDKAWIPARVGCNRFEWS